MDDLPVSAALFTVGKDSDAFEDRKKEAGSKLNPSFSLNKMKPELMRPELDFGSVIPAPSTWFT